MFLVRIDILPHGSVEDQFNQTTIAAYNDGTGTSELGNYRAFIVPSRVVARGDAEVKQYVLTQPENDGAIVLDFPRGHDQHHLPALTAEIIDALGCREFLAA